MALKNVTLGAVLAVVLMAAGLVPSMAAAETATTSASTTTVATTTTTNTTQSALLAQVQSLMKLIAELQSKLSVARGELEEAIKDGLVEGMEDEDIKKIQELLASDSEIYPEGKVTGFFGPLTREAIKRFQTRYELEVTGKLDEETRDLMKELFKERQAGKVPPGLLKSTEARKRVMDRLQAKWGENCDLSIPGRGNKCEKPWKDNDDNDNDDDEDEDEEENDDDDNASSTANRDDARKAIADAQKAINELIEEIDDVNGDDATTTAAVEAAEDALADAKTDLTAARADYSDGEYQDAYDAAKQVEEDADDAKDDLEDATDDDGDDEEDEENDDDEDDD